MIIVFFKALLLTWLIEATVSILILSKKYSLLKILTISLALNLLTLPFVWFIFPAVLNNYTLFIIISETFAFLTEGFILYTVLKDLPLAIKVSFLSNSTSFLIGLILIWKYIL